MKTVSSRVASFEPSVLYGDYNGWWDHLSHVYYSVDSQVIVSQHPESMIEELDSFYCPSCREFFVEGEAQLQGNRCSKCLGCPVCSCVLEIVALPPASSDPSTDPSEPPKLKYCYCCSHCYWLSDGIGLVSTDPTAISSSLFGSVLEPSGSSSFMKVKLMLKNETEDGRKMKRFSTMPSLLSVHSDARRRGISNVGDGNQMKLKRAASMLATRPVSDKNEKRMMIGEGPKKVDEIEQKLKEKLESLVVTDAKKDSPLFLDARGVYDAVLAPSDESPAPEILRGAINLHALSTVEERLSAPFSQQMNVSHLLPHRVPMSTKRSRRCRKDAEEGKPGILIKPSVNPMEGDSSQPTNAGKWWKKDASAIHHVPHIKIVALPNIQLLYELKTAPLVLKITNPTISAVHVRLVAADPGDKLFSTHLPLQSSFHVCPFPCVKNMSANASADADSQTNLSFDVQIGPALDEYADEEAPELPESLREGDLSKLGENSPVVLHKGADTAWLQLNLTLGESYAGRKSIFEDQDTSPQVWLVVPMLLEMCSQNPKPSNLNTEGLLQSSDAMLPCVSIPVMVIFSGN